MERLKELREKTLSDNKLQEKARLVRKWCLLSTTEAGSGHPTSCLSAADLTTVLFDRYFTYDLENPLNLYNDRFLLSKGHDAPLLYALIVISCGYSLGIYIHLVICVLQ